MRLNAYLARSGQGSRRQADELIRSGRVSVNGRPGQLNNDIGPSDRVEVDGRPVTTEPLRYVLLYKPADVVTTLSDPQKRRTVADLVDLPERIVPVGRLDVDTTGLLLLTNDGALAHRLMHPRFEVDKVYEAEVEGAPAEAVLEQLRRGVELEDGSTSPAQVRRIGPSTLELVIHEGRKRQVRRMLEHVGHPVRRLHRPRYGSLTLEGLRPGEWRLLTTAEVDRLRN
jgi:23S rRNA pseudouridine2605 synthase